MLKHLVIEKCQDVKSIQIHNSNIVSLRISEVENLILINVPKLTEVVVIEQICNNWSRVFSQLSCCLSQLEKFSLVTVFPQELMKDSEFPELSKLKFLRMNVGAWKDHSLMVLTSMIKACPCLERFVLQLCRMGILQTNRETEGGAECTHKYLKSDRVFWILWPY
ncbi:hypothetical protein ACH5RR_026809 [Cinchona calisaya]|uniref:At1g61320/AtMIF1 LRR domain-containing protein n=1 Tax=Cinchona calisaya TaxID=153742 RepID=A0ABD2Z3M8_9GENT